MRKAQAKGRAEIEQLKLFLQRADDLAAKRTAETLQQIDAAAAEKDALQQQLQEEQVKPCGKVMPCTLCCHYQQHRSRTYSSMGSAMYTAHLKCYRGAHQFKECMAQPFKLT